MGVVLIAIIEIYHIIAIKKYFGKYIFLNFLLVVGFVAIKLQKKQKKELA